MKPNLVMNKVVTLIFHLTQLAPMIQSSQGLHRSVTDFPSVWMTLPRRAKGPYHAKIGIQFLANFTRFHAQLQNPIFPIQPHQNRVPI